MSKKIYTIQSSDKSKFDKQVNLYLKIGSELHDNGYKVIETNDGLIYSQVVIIDTEEIRDATNYGVEFFDNGQISGIGSSNGTGPDNKNGQWTFYYTSGNIIREAWYKNGKLDGPQTEYYENGQKKELTHWEDDVHIGKWIEWWDNGNKRFEQNMIGELGPYGAHEDSVRKPCGKSIRWHKNGQLESEQILDNGWTVGKYFVFDEYGRKREELNHNKKGQLLSITEWDEDGVEINKF